MQPEAEKLVVDALLAARDVRQYVDGRDLEGYRADGLLRAAVERKLMIVGEALNRLSRFDPSSAEEIPDLPRVVAFRNHLVHGYASVDDTLVWGIVESRLPRLLSVLERLAPGY